MKSITGGEEKEAVSKFRNETASSYKKANNTIFQSS